MTVIDRHVTGGVDTHLDVHVAAAFDSRTHQRLGSESFPATPPGYLALLDWLASFGDVDVVGVESTGSYGAGLAKVLADHGVRVIEIDRPNRKARRLNGKSDTLDAEAAGRAVMSGEATTIPKSHDGDAEAARVLEVTYHLAVGDRTRAINQFKSLLVTAPEPFRSELRQLKFDDQLERARRLRTITTDTVTMAARTAFNELARRIEFLDAQMARLETELLPIVTRAAPALLGLHGVGPHVAAQLLAAAGDNPERMRSEAAFAKLCGACPQPASSGKTNRYRLSRGGDRRANNALYRIVLVRMRHDPRTRTYAAFRTTQGKSRPEIIRCLKRFVAREIYNVLINPPDIVTGAELRALRQQRGLGLEPVATANGTYATHLSRLERGLVHHNDRAREIRSWLIEHTPDTSASAEPAT